MTGLTGAFPGVTPPPCASAVGGIIPSDADITVVDKAKAQVRFTCARFFFQLVKQTLLRVQFFKS
jgi:hypothetical protein